MALRTKNAIRRSFIELLAERPFDKISVRDIAERSEVTRNTFYYYYTDIYALAEDVFESEIEKLSERVEGYESWQKAFLTATSFAAENKRMILHLHNSAHSDILVWGDRIFEKCGIGRDEGGDGGKTLEIRGKRRLSARDGGANYQQS